MKPATLEKALHKWPLWEHTIIEARTHLNFKPMILEDKEQTSKWEAEVGWDRAIGVCLEAMPKMGLPWYFGFYWLACFCASYRDGQSIAYSRINVPPENVSQAWKKRVEKQYVKDRGFILLYHKKGTKNKLYPPYPFLIETSFPFGLDRGEKPPESQRYGTIKVEVDGKPQEVSGIFEVDQEGNVQLNTDGSISRTLSQIKAPTGIHLQFFFGDKPVLPPTFIVDFPLFLATEDVISMAFKQIQVYREGFRHYISHPLLKYSEQVKIEPDAETVENMREPHEDINRYNKGELTFEELIRKEWQRELDREGRLALKLKHRRVSLSRAQTTIYHRIRRRLLRARITPPKPRKGWRSELEYHK